jgi:signal transduction histidine kinase
MILVLLLVLTVSQVVSTAIHYSDRADSLTILGGGHVAERIATIARLIDGTAPDRRGRLIEAVNGPTLRVSLGAESAAQEGEHDDWHTQILEENLKFHLSGFAPDAIKVEFFESEKGRWALPAEAPVNIAAHPMDLVHSHMRHMMGELALGRKVRVSVRLADSSWLNFTTPVAEPTEFWSPRFLVSLAVMAITVIVISIWAVRRATEPLATFGRAAERLGRDVRAPPIPERGPGEVRKAVQAFNRMQDRIRSFVDDRLRMVAAISHDLRTPITRLRFRAEFVEDDVQQQKMLADLDEMENMISTTLAFARDEASSEPTQNLDLVTLVQRVCDDMADAGATVSFEGKGPIPCHGKLIALRRAFANLIDNAVKYGAAAEVSLRAERDSVTVRVEDRGPGIAREDQEKVFEAFYRLDRSRSRETGGTGLGLTVAQNIIRAHGGTIALSNRPDGGLRVEATLPR